MSKMKEKLEKQILEFVTRFYQNDADIVDKTTNYIAWGEYGRVVTLMEQVERNHRRNVGVLHFEVLGYAYQLYGESLAESDLNQAMAQYENALATYEKGMHFATGSGEGWAFRTLFDRAKSRVKRLKKNNQDRQ